MQSVGPIELRLAADQAEHPVLRLLRTGLDAGAAAEAAQRIDDRMHRYRLDEARRSSLIKGRTARIFMAPPPDGVQPPDQGQWQHVYGEQ